MGLGLMGAALARAIQQAGHGLCMWNRSAGKTAPFVEAGARGVTSVAEAVAASEVILVYIDSYASTTRLLGAMDVVPLLAGKTIVQLTTGTPGEARASAASMAERGAGYLDGAIKRRPKIIATPTGVILLAGAKAAHAWARPVLDCLVGDLRYLGENVAAAAVLDLAWQSVRYGLFLGAAHGARLCEAEGVGVDDLAALLTDVAPARRVVQAIHDVNFERPTATLVVWREALRPVQAQARDVAINSEIPDFTAEMLERALALGLGEEEVAARIKVLR